MGFNTVLFICNDAMGTIDDDPKGWWEETKKHIFEVAREPITYNFKNHIGYFTVVSSRHADDVSLIATGGNMASIIDVQWGHRGKHYDIDSQIEILKAALKRLQKEKKNEKPQL